jgi:hypothetical protein
MNNRLDEINNIINKLGPTIKRNKLNVSTTVEKIKEKYASKLKKYEYIDVKNITTRMILRYVTLDGLSLKIPGVVTNVEIKNNIIKTITLLNNTVGIIWKIKPRKYYIFRYNGSMAKKDSLRRSLDDMLEEQIMEYIKKNK